MKYTVRVHTKEEAQTYLEAVEKWTDWRWAVGGEKPTEWNPFVKCEGDENLETCCIRFEDDFSWFNQKYYEDPGYTIISLKTALLMLEWPAGTRVRATEDRPKGKPGTVVGWRKEREGLVVAFDDWDEGHDGIMDGDYRLSEEHKHLLTGENGRFMEPKDLEKLDTATPFPHNKTFKELGLDKNRKFIVLDDDHYKFSKGDILEWVEDEDDCPFFRNQDGVKGYCHLYRLAYYDEPLPDELTPEEKDKTATELFLKAFENGKPLFTLPPKPTLMSTLTGALRKLTRPEPKKTYVELGITDEGGDLTPEGLHAYVQHLFKSNEQEKDSQFFKNMKKVLDARNK